MAPALLLTKSECKESVASYNPQKVMRQLGYGQPARMSNGDTGYSSALKAEDLFIRQGKDQILASVEKYFWT